MCASENSIHTPAATQTAPAVRAIHRPHGVSFSSSTMVMENMDGLYAYLKGRSNGDITQSKVEELK